MKKTVSFFSEVELQGGFIFKLSLGSVFPRASHRLAYSGAFILATSWVWLHLISAPIYYTKILDNCDQ